MTKLKNKAETSGPEKRAPAAETKPAGGKEPQKVNLCDNCLYTYPRCGGDRAPGFKTEDGRITECSMHQVKASLETEAEFRAEEPAAVKTKPAHKPIPERLRLKREIQAENLAR